MKPASDAGLEAALQHHRAGRLGEAERLYRRVLQADPGHVAALGNLGAIFQQVGKLDEAVACYRQVIRQTPEMAEMHRNLGAILKRRGQSREAVASLKRALVLRPNYAEALNDLGSALHDLGYLEEGRQRLERAVALAGGNAEFHYALSVTKRFTAADPQLRALETLRPASVQQELYLRFSLGKAYEDIGEHARSFDHYLAGNALRRRLGGYDEAATLSMFERIQAAFPARIAPVGDATGPIFIVGMPRSGSSLIEQILASHPQVEGIGETDLFDRAVATTAGRDAFPDSVDRLSSKTLRRLGETYLAGLKAKAPRAERIVDKMPENSLFCGLIAMVLPHARILYSRRDPVDTCLSCFSKLFDGYPYAYDLGELGRYHRAHDRLMEHWRRVLPGMLLEVSYEDLVADLEGQTRRMLDFCGLDWDQACLDFHTTQRSVRTASATEVRRPIYASSVGRWRPEDELIVPLMVGLSG
jgi:tetratricopeptide (TPR) repeat protein